MLKALLLIIFISNPLLAHSDELARDACSPIRLDDEGGAMEHVEVRNQQQIGSCYAHTAAQMYDSWRFTNGDEYYGRQSSGFEIGQRFKIRESVFDEDEKSIDGGFVEQVMPLLLQQGSCSQEEMDGMFNSGTVDQYASSVMRIFRKYQKKYYEFAAKERFKKIHEIEKIVHHEPSVVIENTAVNSMRSREINEKYLKDQILKNNFLEEGVVELKKLNDRILRVKDLGIHYEDLKADGDTVDMFNVISIINCADARKIKTNVSFRVKNHSTEFSAIDNNHLINHELNQGLKGAHPIGIAYCSQLLGQGLNFQTPSWDSHHCGRHASMVVGRRRNPETNKCEYLIRNSWGKSCSGYSKDWTCEKNQGSVWVDSEKLSENIHDLQIIR